MSLNGGYKYEIFEFNNYINSTVCLILGLPTNFYKYMCFLITCRARNL